MTTSTSNCALTQSCNWSRAARSACSTLDTVNAAVPGTRTHSAWVTVGLQSVNQTASEPLATQVMAPITGLIAKTISTAPNRLRVRPSRESTGVNTRACSLEDPATLEKNRSRIASGKCQTNSAHVTAML